MKGDYVEVAFLGTIEGEVRWRKTDADGTPVVNFTVVADTESHTTGKATQERVNVAAFGRMATDNEAHLKPGVRVHGKGRQQTRKGRDRPDVVMSLFVPLGGG